MEEWVYECEGNDIETVAESLVRCTAIPLYLNQSPMIGPWYSSEDPEPMWRAFHAKDYEALQELEREY